VVFVHCASTPGEAICADELMALASRREQVDLRLRFTAVSGRLGDADWEALARETGDAPAYVCGPAAFMAAASRAWTARRAWISHGLAENLHFERFALEPAETGGAAGGMVVAARSGKTFVAAPGQTLLVAAEAAGLRPKHGCRVGICHTCVCRKVSGATVDVRNGRISDEPGEIIQLCVNVPRTAVTLEL
jgi:stearoyl-CoA 9-desaturase NADPH oxidoreductase